MLDKILSGISFVCVLIGLAGRAGAVETGTGFMQSMGLIIVGAVFGVWAGYESGYFRRRMN